MVLPKTVRTFIFSLSLLIFCMSNFVMATEYWIDVRTQEEFDAGHIDGAAHIPYEEVLLRIHEVTDNKDAVIHLYCRSGRRSGFAQEALSAHGFSNAINEGGYEDLLRARQDLLRAHQ